MRKRNKGENHPEGSKEGPQTQENNTYYKKRRKNYGNEGPSEDESYYRKSSNPYKRGGRGQNGRGRGSNNRYRNNNYYNNRNKNDEEGGQWVSKRGGNNYRRGRGRGGGNGYYKKDNPENESQIEVGIGAYKGKRSRGGGQNNYQKSQREEFIQPDYENEEEKIREKTQFQWQSCLICLVKINPRQPIWNCGQCNKTVHLKCIKDWIFKSNDISENDRKKQNHDKIYNWQCPHCMFQFTQKLPKYYCFCRKTKNPVRDPYLEPHSCGKKCGKFAHESCNHPCQLLCHSGNCNPCDMVLPKEPCFCGKEMISRKCQEFRELNCSNICGKVLNCGKHYCQEKCHPGDCGECQVKKQVDCFCGKVEDKTVFCGGKEDKSSGFECGLKCDKLMNCGLHKCEINCHSG